MNTPPEHLSQEARAFFKSISEDYLITDAAGLKILTVACEAYDRAQAARAKIDEDGLTVTDKFNQIKPHPLLSNERDSRAAFLAGLKALNLDIEPLQNGPGRPPGR